MCSDEATSVDYACFVNFKNLKNVGFRAKIRFSNFFFAEEPSFLRYLRMDKTGVIYISIPVFTTPLI